MDDRLRWASLALVAGGLSWSVVRGMVLASWSTPVLGLSYNDANRLMLPVMAMLLAGVLLMHSALKAALGAAARVFLMILAVGCALQLAGVFVEFGIGSGLQGGTRALAMWGWGIYLLGCLVVPQALCGFGLSARRQRFAGAWFWRMPLLMAALGIYFFPAMMFQQRVLGVLNQVLFGLVWAAYGLGLRKIRVTGCSSASE